MEREFTPILKELDMKEVGKMISSMDMGLSIGQRGQNMKAITHLVSRMVMENILMQMVQSMKVSGG